MRSKQPEASDDEREEGELRLEELNAISSRFILRRTQDIISKYLPPKVIRKENYLFKFNGQ